MVENKNRRRAQAAIMDSLFFMVVCSGAAVLLFSVSTLYNSNTNRQITSIYNNEFASTALVSLHYVKYADSNSNSEKWFWMELGKKLAQNNPEEKVNDFILGTGKPVWDALTATSPSANTQLCFSSEGLATSFCTPATISTNLKTVYVSNINTKDSAGNEWTVSLKLSY